jgi:hypothetical protein
MFKKIKYLYNTYYHIFEVKKPWDMVIIFILNILISIPVFIIVHQNTITVNWKFHLDRILIAIAILVVIQLILRAMRKITLVSIFLYLIALLIGTVLGKYGFTDVAEDYNSMLFAMEDNPNPQDIIIGKLLPFPNKSKIINAIEYENPKVRNFAIMATTKHFKNLKKHKNYRMLIQCFAVFKEINSRWNYVNDPANKDYIAKASESLLYFSGDCDDHSILMAACVKAIGGTPRLIYTGDHIYPEILIGTKSDLENINFIIKKEIFKKENKGKTLHYHIDERGKIWLNLDYTANYPGGPFLKKSILAALTL